MAENRGVTTIWVEDLATKAVTRLTDTASNNADPKWSADGEKIYFLSDRSGSMQVWRMAADGTHARQITGAGGGEGIPDVEGFGVAPDENTSGGCRPSMWRHANRRTSTTTCPNRKPASTTI